MPKPIEQDYFKRETAEVAHFITSLKDNAAPGGTFDSAAAADFMTGAMNQNPGAKIPATLQAVFDDCKDEGERERVTRAILDGVKIYEDQHGMSVPADVAEQGFASGLCHDQRRPAQVWRRARFGLVCSP